MEKLTFDKLPEAIEQILQKLGDIAFRRYQTKSAVIPPNFE